MKPTYLFTLFLVVTTTLMAQRPDTPWQINAGLNVVDLFPTGVEYNFFPNQGGFFEDFLKMSIGILEFLLLGYIAP